MENLSLRISIKEAGFTYRQIADEIGITYSYLSRLMAKPLSSANQIRVLSAIQSLKEKDTDV